MYVLRESLRRKSKSCQISLHSHQPHLFRRLCLEQCVLFTQCFPEMTMFAHLWLLLFVCLGEFIYFFID